MVASSKEDVKPVLSRSPQIRSAPSNPSPLRNTVVGSDVPQHTHHDGQPADGQERTSLAQVRPRNPSGTFQVGRLPQQGSSSKGEPLFVHQRSDSDPDFYFNDEDNDAFLAVEDSAMQSVESPDALGTIGSSSGKGPVRNTEISRGGSPPAPALVKSPSQCIVQS